MDWQKIVESLNEVVGAWGARIVGALVAIVVAWMIAGWASRSLRNGLEKKSFDATLTRFFSNMLRYLILIGAGLGILGVFGVETTSFAAVIGAAGLAVGLAFQGTLSNFAAGMMLLIFRPFKVGDLVKVAGCTGTIEQIDLFTTEFRTLDSRRVIVPNGSIFGAVIENITYHPTRRVDIDVGTDYGADIEETRGVLEGMVDGIEGVLDEPAPQIFLKGLGSSSVDWQVRVWCETERYWDVWQATITQTKKALDGAGIGIPFPQTDVHFDPPVLEAIAGGKK